MAKWHLDDLGNALGQKGWSVLDELAGNDYDLSGSWEIQRSTRESACHIDFEGLDDMKTLPISQAYGCHLREDRKAKLYFSKQQTWPERLKRFLAALETAAVDPATGFS